MADLDAMLQRRRLIVEVPTAERDVNASLEVMIQEGIRAFSLPPARLADAVAARALFSRRAAIGVHGLTSADQVMDAVAAGVDFLSSPFAEASLVEAAAGTPIALGGMTLAEVRAAGLAGPTAVLLSPEAFDWRFLDAVAALGLGLPVYAARSNPADALAFLANGASAIVLAPGVLFGLDGDLLTLRSRCQEFARVA